MKCQKCDFMLLAMVGISMLAPTGTLRAGSPQQLAEGQKIFIQTFTASPSGSSGGGLGPVFNESSCVACHNQGGVGGGGDVSKNARSFGVSRAVVKKTPAMVQSGMTEDQAMVDAIKKFSPGFVDKSGAFNASFPLHRRGGSPKYHELRNRSLHIFNPHWNDDQNLSTDTVHAERNGKSVQDPTSTLDLTVHVYARNTTSLFGAGWIDSIPDSALLQAAKMQRRSSEVSGRPGTLDDGRIGKFGWRANFATLLDFNRSACAAELGLQSESALEAEDFTRPVNNGPGDGEMVAELSEERMEALNQFVSTLARPEQRLPESREAVHRVHMGERLFAQVGCATCHQPNLGNVHGLFSDLLLHEMGPYSQDTASAPPYRTDYEFETTLVSRQVPHPYYGTLVTMVDTIEESKRPGLISNTPSSDYIVRSPSEYPPGKVVATIGPLIKVFAESAGVESRIGNPFAAVETKTFQQTSTSKPIPTRVNEEWRTPPLWGVADSAPYMHDGRAATLLESIEMHDGEARGSRNRFSQLSLDNQQAIIEFLETLVAPQSGVIPVPPQHQMISIRN
jgi:CxxC motif-containing protein (DUF1111 family)